MTHDCPLLHPDCPPLESAVAHLRASTVEVSPGAQVQLSCDPGFYLVGEPVLQCQNRGEWSHPLPRCEREFRAPPAFPPVRCVPLLISGTPIRTNTQTHTQARTHIRADNMQASTHRIVIIRCS